MKRIMAFVLTGMLLASTYGCVALLAGAVGGAPQQRMRRTFDADAQPETQRVAMHRHGDLADFRAELT